jgi:hypothetical protein
LVQYDLDTKRTNQHPLSGCGEAKHHRRDMSRLCEPIPSVALQGTDVMCG